MKRLLDGHGVRHALLLLLALGSSLLLVAAAQAQSVSSNSVGQALKFRNIGPAVAGGRVTSVAGIPGNPNVYYVGTAGGGVWKSTNGGNSWTQLLAHADTSSIGDVAVAPSNPNLIWVGTGEANVRSDTITGAGVYFSPDAGKTWKFMGLKDTGQISRIVIDPKNPDIVFVAALGNPWKPNSERGVYRTTNGGKTWKKVLYVNDKTGASDLIMEPGNPKILFAGMWSVRRYPWNLVDGSKTGGIWESTDGGSTWTQLHSGLPNGVTGRISLAAAPSNPEHLYAVIPTHHGMLWASDDLGAHWHMVSNDQSITARQWYFAGVAVDPDNQNRVYFNSVHLMVSNNGGKTVHVLDPAVHPDHHTVWIDPDNPDRIIQGNDGGVFLSNNEGKTWRFLDTLPIEQAYTVSVDSQKPFHACVGLQDNSAWCGPTSALNQPGVTGKNWFTTVGGDGEYAVIAPSDPNIVYADLEDGYTTRINLKTHVTREIRPSTSFGLQNTEKSLADSKYRFNWTTPLAVSPHHANTVYIGAQVLFKSTNGGKTWKVISPDLTRNDKSKQTVPGGPVFHDITSAENYDTIMSITLAPTAPGKVIWAGSDDGLVHVTRDGGKHWENVTPGGAPKWARVYQIGVSPFNAGTAYVSFDGHMLGNDRAYVYKTTNYGRSWSRITRGLPAHTPVEVVREDPHHKGLLVAGTMTGLYYSLNDGNNWHPLKANLPTMPVWDLKFAPDTDALAVATHGHGLYVLDNLRPLEEWSNKVEASDFHLFNATPGTLFNHWSTDEGQQLRYMAPNAEEGVVFSYYLKKAIKPAKGSHKGPVKIVISRNGQMIDTLHGPGKAGLNQVAWNMNYSGPTPMGKGHRHPGPDVMSGQYKAAITAGKHTATQDVSVAFDPNITVNASDYQAQLKLALEFTAMMSTTNEMINRLNAWNSQLGSIQEAIHSGHRDKNLGKQADALAKKIKNLKDELLQPDVQHNVAEGFLHTLPRLRGEIRWNSFSLGGYAQAPGQPILEKAAELHSKLNGYVSQFNALRSKTIGDFNQAAYKAGVGTLSQGKTMEIETKPLP
ncbi:MAG TPA: hypothetical protein VFA48_00880 [Gammaproteobacteria bacterium]|nr:hypothetical protein [Gammaproteobacteria bacterium]